MDSDTAHVRAELRKIACDIGVIMSRCQSTGQLSCAARLASARNDVLAGIESYNPPGDERQLTLDNVVHTSL